MKIHKDTDLQLSELFDSAISQNSNSMILTESPLVNNVFATRGGQVRGSLSYYSYYII